MRDLKTFQQLRRVFNALYLQPDRIQAIKDVLQACLCFEVVFKPCQRELHERAPTPAERVG